MTHSPPVLETRFVLPADVLIVPVATLSESARAGLDCAAQDFAVARPRGRRPSSIVDPTTASLLRQFRQPSRLVDAVLRFSRERGSDPEQTLEGAFTVLQTFCNTKLLVREEEAQAERIEPSFAPGQKVAEFEIQRLIHLLEDTELYLARDADGQPAALKLWRGEPGVDDAIGREAAILSHLAGTVSPRLLAHGEEAARPFLAATWRTGLAITAVADELRAMAGSGRRELLQLARRLVAAYASLHRQGVVHGDVHPGNLLVDADGSVSLLDFGSSRMLDPASPYLRALRAAMPFYFDPQTAAAILAEQVPPECTRASDQYAVGVLLYRLFTGQMPVDFPSEQERLLRQVVEAAPLPFSRRGVRPWPQVEAVLHRALAKEPERRFASMAQLHQALEAVAEPAARQNNLDRRASNSKNNGSPSAMVSAKVSAALARYGLSSPLLRDGLPTAPRVSLWTGSAGVVWFLYRAAMVRGDGELLALADGWIERSEQLWSDEGRAFYSAARGITPEHVGTASPFHTRSGLHAVGALLARSRGDRKNLRRHLTAFLTAAGGRSPSLDLTLGSSGLVVAATALFEAASRHADAAGEAALLKSFIERLGGELWNAVGGTESLAHCPRLPHLGMAHGWAGLLYALLRAAQVCDNALSEGIVGKLEALADAAQPAGRGLLWPGTLGNSSAVGQTPDLAPGWCSGSAGYVHLWLAAYDRLGGDRYLALAERAGWAAWEHPDSNPTLCCGTAGRALALAALYRHGGESGWRDRARALLARAGKIPGDPAGEGQGLFKGALGAALAAVELEDPEHAIMPLFGG